MVDQFGRTPIEASGIGCLLIPIILVIALCFGFGGKQRATNILSPQDIKANQVQDESNQSYRMAHPEASVYDLTDTERARLTWGSSK